MARHTTIPRLAARNSLRAWGRLIILVLLLGSAIVARSSVYLVQGGLVAEAEEAVAGGSLPKDYNVVAVSLRTSYSPDMLAHYLRGLDWKSQYRRSLDAVVGYCERHLGPSGEIWIVAPYTGEYRAFRDAAAEAPRNWYEFVLGEYPDEPGEVAVPRPYAEAYGLDIGDRLTLRPPETHQEPAVFTVTALYEPKGRGPFYEYFLTAMPEPDPASQPQSYLPSGGEPQVKLNFLATRLTSAQIAIMRTWGGDPESGAAGFLVYEFIDPNQRMASLARAVYGSRSEAVDLGSSLVGVAVLVVLLVAMVERRREAAIYKMVGMSSYMTLGVLVLELAVAAGGLLVRGYPLHPRRPRGLGRPALAAVPGQHGPVPGGGGPGGPLPPRAYLGGHTQRAHNQSEAFPLPEKADLAGVDR